MYEAKTTGFLELLMNALTLPSARRVSHARRGRPIPRRHEAAVAPSALDAMTAKGIFIEAARLSRWNR